MKIQIVGIQKVDYFSKKRNCQVVGKSISYVDLGTVKTDLIGYTVGEKFIPADNPNYSVPLTCNGIYTMYLNGYAVDYLAPVEQPVED